MGSSKDVGCGGSGSGVRRALAPAQEALNPFEPPRHLPAVIDPKARALRQAEMVQILNARGTWESVTALLDTGNEHLTCIDEAFATGLGLFDPSPCSSPRGSYRLDDAPWHCAGRRGIRCSHPRATAHSWDGFRAHACRSDEARAHTTAAARNGRAG